MYVLLSALVLFSISEYSLFSGPTAMYRMLLRLHVLMYVK